MNAGKTASALSAINRNVDAGNNASAMRFVILTQTATPYNNALFSALQARESAEMHVWVMRSGEGADHYWKQDWQRAYSQSSYRPGKKLQWPVIAWVMRQRQCVVISNGWQDPTSLILSYISVLRPGIKFCFWADCPVPEGRTRGSLRRSLRRVLLWLAFRTSHRVLGTGRPAAQALKKMSLPDHKFVNMPYYIPLERYQRAPVIPSSGKVYLLCAGRLVDELKHFSLAILAMGLLRQQGRGRRLILRIAGDGPDRDKLIALAKTEGVEDAVEFVGWLEADQMASLYRECHLLVHPAVFEPYGVVVLEAMASGMLVLASDQAMAAVDRIERKKNGLIHQEGNSRAIAEDIQWVLEHISEANQLAEEGLRKAREWPLERGVDTLSSLAEDF